MSLLEALSNQHTLLALSLFTAISILVEAAGHKLLNSIHEIEVTHWVFEHTLIPVTRTLALVTFILISYPILFGIEEAPAISELLNAGQLRLTNLVNIIFLLSLFLPLIPIFSRWPALVLPIQGITATTIVFGWLSEKISETQVLNDIHYWPGWSVIIGLLVLAFVTHELAKQISHRLEKKIDKTIEREGSGKIIYRAVIMILQAPVILLYSLHLGQQLQ